MCIIFFSLHLVLKHVDIHKGFQTCAFTFLIVCKVVLSVSWSVHSGSHPCAQSVIPPRRHGGLCLCSVISLLECNPSCVHLKQFVCAFFYPNSYAKRMYVFVPKCAPLSNDLKPKK